MMMMIECDLKCRSQHITLEKKYEILNESSWMKEVLIYKFEF